MGHYNDNLANQLEDMDIKLPKDYAKLKESDFPTTINGIEYKTKQELTGRYKSDLIAYARLIYDIYREKQSRLSQSKPEPLDS